MVRSGIILPFQFRDCKKLIQIGVPEENRELSIWDLKNVVRAAFGIYNFEFRNKKIGFNIPDELLLHYLAQRHDLTNFVIEIGQANDETTLKNEPFCSGLLSYEVQKPATQQQQQQQQLQLQQNHISPPLKSNESTNGEQALSSSPIHYPMVSVAASNLVNSVATTNMAHISQGLRSPQADCSTTNHSDQSNSNLEPPLKLRISSVYSERTPESLTQSIDPMDIIPKSEEQEEAEADVRLAREQAMQLQQQQQLLQQQQIQQQQQQQQHQLASSSQPPPAHYFPSYAHGGMLANASASSSTHQYSPAMMNRFRRRGERMSKDQKELYVKYFEENTCMLTQRRNDIMLEPHWLKLCNMLNTVPQGAVKNVEEWKQTFDAWRYRVFMYTRYNSKLTGPAAQNPKNYKPLTPTDQRAYSMWTSHKNTTPQDFEKMDMFANLDETQTDYDY